LDLFRVYTEKGNQLARRVLRDPTGIGLFPEWSWVWPVNRRIIYNRASVDLEGRPFNPKKPVIWWTGTKWMGDVPTVLNLRARYTLHHAAGRFCGFIGMAWQMAYAGALRASNALSRTSFQRRQTRL
jgi:hypothetical protein